MTGLEEAQMRLTQAIRSARRDDERLLADDLSRVAAMLLGLRLAHGLIDVETFNRDAEGL